MRLGVDTGGTFTDFVWLDAGGRLQIHKQLSTPADPSRAILSGIAQLGIPAEAPVVHGSTVATNTLLERRGARTALITTRGFADVLAIGRQNRPDLYALVPQKPPPLIPRRWRLEVDERVTADGEVLIPLEPASLQPVLDCLAAEQIESVAVCLLFSFLHPEHEQSIRRALEGWLADGQGAASDFHISLSSEILPEYREYERTAAVVVNAYVAPKMRRYLDRLAAGLRPRPLTVMQSNGGIISATTAGEQAARTVLSGPAGGVVGARYVAHQAGFDNIITFDMGGTSTDVALCPGRLPTTVDGEIAGLPLRLPIIDIHTVGAGGGSLAFMDAGGALHVGPESAGAEPGPACYGLPVAETDPVLTAVGSRATTTDANLLLGRLDAVHFLGGTMSLFPEAARDALSELAGQMGAPSPEAAAWGVIQVSNATMERAIRRISVERGYDPREFTLVPFGGAGPLHACELADGLQIPRVLIPPVPGVLSALGMLVAAPTRDYSRTVMAAIDPVGEGIDGWLVNQFEPLQEQAAAEMTAAGYLRPDLEFVRSLDMRYVGQSHELNVRLPEASRPSLTELFHAAHEQRYGYRQAEAVVELVTVRLSVIASVRPPVLDRSTASAGTPPTPVDRKSVWFGPEEPVETSLYERDQLQPGHQLNGPAVIFQYDTTTVIPPGWQGRVDNDYNLVLTRSNGQELTPPSLTTRGPRG